MRTILSSFAVLTFLATAATTASAADWPHFNGPDRTGVSHETALLQSWPENGPEQLWRVPVGEGFGGAAIRDGRVYLLDREGDERDVLRVFDLDTGEEQWSHAYTREGRLSHHGSRSTPAVDDEIVFAVGGFGDVYAVDRESGESVWHFNLAERFEEGDLNWGFAQSPLVLGDHLILTPTHPESPGLIAVDKQTGDVVWESEPFGGDYYASPDRRTIAGTEGLLQITNRQLSLINPENGETIWIYDGWNCRWPIPSPTVLDDGQRIFITGGYEAGSVMIRVNESGGEHSFDELFRLEGGAQLHTAIQIDDHLYLNLNENATLRRETRQYGGLACIDPDEGEVVWRTGEEPNFDRGNVIYADGRLIVLDGQNGLVHLINPSPEGFQEVSQARVFDPDRPRGNNIWAPIALGDGRLVVRDHNEMVALDLRAD